MLLRVEGMPTGKRGGSGAALCEGKCVPMSYLSQSPSDPISGVRQDHPSVPQIPRPTLI